MAEGAPLLLTCDVEQLVEGSAIKRWILPGWGTSKGAVAVTLWRMPEQKVLGTFRSHSSLGGGGLFSLGAEHYILDVAVRDIVDQMEAWAMGVTRETRRTLPDAGRTHGAEAHWQIERMLS